MPLTKYLARGFKFYVEDPTSTDAAKKFTGISGIVSFSKDPSAERSDTTDFNSDGFATHVIAQRSNELGLEGHYVSDAETGAQDAGQAIVEANGELIGVNSVSSYRIKFPDGNTYEYRATTEMGALGGGTNDNTSWAVTLGVTGKPVKIESDTATYTEPVAVE